MPKWGPPLSKAPLCACGCGEHVCRKGNQRVWNQFLSGHFQRLQGKRENAYRWNGGQHTHGGYVMVFMPDHHRTNGKYVRRCILVAETKLGRLLKPREVVHHINQIRDDDRPENLHVFPSQSEHIRHHNLGVRRGRSLTEANVKEIKRLLKQPPSERIRRRGRKGLTGRPKDPACMSGIARKFGVTPTLIHDIRNGKLWGWVKED